MEGGGVLSQIKADRDLGGRRLTPLTLGLPSTDFIYLFSKDPKACSERSSMKHSSHQGSRDAAPVSEHPNGL